MNKRQCSAYAQPQGVGPLFSWLDRVSTAPTPEEKKNLVHSLEMVDFWQALRTGAGAYAGCPRCLAVCPVGEDYTPHLKETHAKIERVKEREEKLATMRAAEREGKAIAGGQISQRWIGR